MRVEKREAYIGNLYVSLHTLMFGSEYLNEAEAEANAKVKYRGKRNDKHSFIINPNKSQEVMESETGMITAFSHTKVVLDEVLNTIKARNEYLVRADLSFNSRNEGDYLLYKKLNRLILCLLMLSEDIKNCYESSSMRTLKDLNMAIKGSTIEAENYDKQAESNGKVPTTNRLELRSKGMKPNQNVWNINVINEFVVHWMARLKNATTKENFEKLQDYYNDVLFKIWREDVAKPKKEREYANVTNFIVQYRDNIYTSNQLIKLLEMMQVKNPRNMAKKIKQKHTIIEFFSHKDLVEVVKGLNRATMQYFAN